MTISGRVLKKYFQILLTVFIAVAVIEFVFTAIGMPLGEMYIAGIDLDQDNLFSWILRSVFSSLFITGIVNFALTLRIIKQALGLVRWPAIPIVLIIVFLPLEILLSVVLVIPNIVIYGITARWGGKGDGTPVSWEQDT